MVKFEHRKVFAGTRTTVDLEDGHTGCAILQLNGDFKYGVNFYENLIKKGLEKEYKQSLLKFMIKSI